MNFVIISFCNNFIVIQTELSSNTLANKIIIQEFKYLKITLVRMMMGIVYTYIKIRIEFKGVYD